MPVRCTRRSRKGRNSSEHPWARVHGTVYGIRYQPRRRLRLAYVGKYAGPWEERIRQHLYGGGPWRCKPKPWADLVPGYDRTATTLAAQKRAVKEVIAQGGAFVIWQSHPTCFSWYLKLRESGSIAWRRPECNIQENLNNPRHVPKWEQEAAHEARMAGRAAWDERATGIRLTPDDEYQLYGQRTRSTPWWERKTG